MENKGKQEVKMQVDARTWDMNDNGEFIETDTGDFVFFPRLVSIAPGSATVVRVGYKGDFPRLEKSYRLYFQELPPIRTPNQPSEDAIQAGVQVLLRLSLPLFVRPAQKISLPSPAVALLGQSENGLRLAIKNTGVNHFGVLSTKTELLTNNKETTVSSSENTKFFRVLPERQMLLELPINTDDCAKADSARITLSFDSTDAANNSFSKTLPLAQNCTPAPE